MKELRDLRVNKKVEEENVNRYIERKKWQRVKRRIVIRFFVVVALVGLIVLGIL